MIGNRIKELRNDKKLTLEEFAKQIGSDHSYLSKLERGKNTNPSEPLIIAICSAFGVNREWLETGKGEKYAENSIVPVKTPEERELLEKVLYVVREQWKGKYDASLKQNIESFYHGATQEKPKKKNIMKEDIKHEHPPDMILEHKGGKDPRGGH